MPFEFMLSLLHIEAQALIPEYNSLRNIYVI